MKRNTPEEYTETWENIFYIKRKIVNKIGNNEYHCETYAYVNAQRLKENMQNKNTQMISMMFLFLRF